MSDLDDLAQAAQSVPVRRMQKPSSQSLSPHVIVVQEQERSRPRSAFSVAYLATFGVIGAMLTIVLAWYVIGFVAAEIRDRIQASRPPATPFKTEPTPSASIFGAQDQQRELPVRRVAPSPMPSAPVSPVAARAVEYADAMTAIEVRPVKTALKDLINGSDGLKCELRNRSDKKIIGVELRIWASGNLLRTSRIAELSPHEICTTEATGGDLVAAGAIRFVVSSAKFSE